MLHAFTSSHGGGCNGCRFFVCFWMNGWACNKSLIFKSRLVWEFRWSVHLVYIWFHLNKKIPLYNTEKNSSFVDMFWNKIYKLFYKNKILTVFIDEDSLPVINSWNIIMRSTANGLNCILKLKNDICFFCFSV